ncbi:MAG: PAS domain S-box protein [Methanomicrobiales archaeon]|nr:PAS domain S-box protein [Methanomicrobiales archaeon]
MSFLDLKGNILIWNLAAEEITGYSGDEVLGRNTVWQLLYPDPEYRKQVTKTIVDIISKEKYLENFETCVCTKQGDLKRISWNTREMKDDVGNRIGYIVIGDDITEIAGAKQELKRFAEFRESIIINAKLWMMFLDKNNNVTLWNKAAEEITGYTTDEVIGNAKIWKWIYPDEQYRRQITKKIIDIIQNKKYLENFETRVLTKQGQIREISWNTRELTGDNEEHLGYIVVGNDITDKVRAKNEIKEREELFHGIAAAANEAIVLIDQNGLIQFWNAAAERIFNMTSADVMQKNFFSLCSIDPYTEEDKNAFNTFFTANTGPFTDRQREMKLKRFSGDIFPAELSLSPVQIHGAWSAIAIIRDISERKKAEKQRVILSEIVKSSSDAIIGLAQDGRIISWNLGAKKIFGYSQGEVIGQNFNLLIPPDKIEEQSENLEKITKGEHISHYETTVVEKSGDQRVIDLAISPVKDSEGTISGASFIARDLTREKKLTREIITFIKETAMRLKTPVEVVEQNIAALLEDLENGETDRHELALQLRLQVKNMEQIRRNLRDLNAAIVENFEEVSPASKKFLSE